MAQESTTPDLEETVRRSAEALSRRDFDAFLSHFAPDSVLDRSAIGMEVHEGRAAIRRFFEDLVGAYEDYETEVREFSDLGNGVTFFVAVQRGRLPGASEFFELHYALVGMWADGLIRRWSSYTDIDTARAAAKRLAEEGG